MRKIILLIILTFGVLDLRAQIPEIEVRDIDQNWISLNDLQGEKFTVIDFWATWCKPCVSSIPKINTLYHEFSKKGLGFIGVNIDGPRNLAKVKPFANTLKIKYPVILDPDQQLVNEFNVTVFPTLLILNSKGQEVFIHEGFNPGDELLVETALKKLLKDGE